MKQQTHGSSQTTVTPEPVDGQSAPGPQQQERSAHSVGFDQGMRVLSYLIGGVLAYGLIGWFADRLLHTSFLLPTGIIVGAVLGVYVIIVKFGRPTAKDAVPTRTQRFHAQWSRRNSRIDVGSGRGVGRR